MNETPKKVFLAANSADGFISHFGDCYKPNGDYSVYILKGGPGTGKSSFMRYMAHRAKQCGYETVISPCTGDPDSLDAVIIPDLKTVFLDGTAPHTVEPKLPGVCEQIINSGEFWNTQIIKRNRLKIAEAQSKNDFYHKTAARYIAAAGQTSLDNLKLSSRYTDFDKLADYRGKLIKKYFTKNGDGAEKFNCFLSGITPDGIISFKETVSENFKSIIVIEDKYGSASNELLRGISAAALLHGYKTVTAKNPLLPNEITDHILIPQLSLAFVTENEFIKWDLPVRRIHARRFYLEGFKSVRARTFFNRRITRCLLLSAANSLKKAKSLHDELESFYISAMDFEGLNIYKEKLADEIFK